MTAAADASEAAELLAAVPASRRVALVDPRFVGHLHALRLGLTDPRFAAASIPGALTAQPEARPALLRALRRAVTAVGAGSPVAPPGAAPVTEERTVPGRLAVALDAEGTAVRRPELGSLTAAVPTGPDERAAAQAAVDAVDDEAVRLRSAVKAHDGFFTTYFISPYSRYIARWCARRGSPPTRSPPPR